MEREPTINIDDFVNKLCPYLESLPIKDLETEVIAGIRHGFDLVRIRSYQTEEDVELKEFLDAKSVGKEKI